MMWNHSKSCFASACDRHVFHPAAAHACTFFGISGSLMFRCQTLVVQMLPKTTDGIVQMKACICAANINNTLEAQRYLGSMLDDLQTAYIDVYLETAASLMQLQLPALVPLLCFRPIPCSSQSGVCFEQRRTVCVKILQSLV